MKTNYLQRNRSRFLYRNQAFALIVLFVVGSIFFSYADGLIIRIFSPIWKIKTETVLAIKNTLDFFDSKGELIAENERLKALLQDKNAEQAEERARASSAQTLLETFGLVSSEQGIPAGVVVHPPQTPYDIIVIDVGANHGIRVGQKVELPGGAEIGAVAEVFSINSKVRLYSSDGEKTNAVLERYSVMITLVGRGGGGFEFELPRDVPVEVGDKILSTDLESRLLGIVGAIEVEPTDSFKKVLVGGAGNIYNLRFVLVRS